VPTTRTTIPLTLLPADRERVLQPKDTFKECANCPEMVVVPAGTFTKGSPPTELKRDDDENPLHPVNFARQFAVGRFAVTFDEWDACVGDGGCNGHVPSDQGWGRGRQPVINVSWDDAKAYVAWLSKITGKPYRLLSEAEREYATRAGTTTPFWFGNSIATGEANYNGTFAYANAAKGEFRGHTVSVNAFAPNAFGVYQVHGNVYDWLEDCYHNAYLGAPVDGAAWTGSGDCTNRVIRGGAWLDVPWGLRSANRWAALTTTRNSSIGFRVARTLLGP
jgi:formylglycine-generating enzyme required for sulfatase activity